MIGLAVYHDRPWKIRRTAVGFGIKVIALAPDCLCQRDTRHREIHYIQRTDFPDRAQNDGRGDAKNEPAVNGQSSQPEIDHFQKITLIHGPVEYNIIKARPDDAGRNADQDKI